MIDIVHVTWVDSSSTNDWREKSDLKEMIEGELLHIDSVGMLLCCNDVKVILVQSAGGHITGTIEIPRACVKEMKTIYTLPISFELD